MTKKRFSNDAVAVNSGNLLSFVFQNKVAKLTKPIAKKFLNKFITLPLEGSTAARMISQLTDIPEEHLGEVNFSAEQLRAAQVLFVLRLSDIDVEQEKIPEAKLVDAYDYAFKTAAEMYGKPELITLGQKLSYIKFSGDVTNNNHSALIIDAKINGKKIPKRKDIRDARDNLEKHFPKDYNGYEANAVEDAKITQSILINQATTLSPLAKKRAELFIESVGYFAPALITLPPNIKINNLSLNAG